jgi:hypothetical protein
MCMWVIRSFGTERPATKIKFKYVIMFVFIRYLTYKDQIRNISNCTATIYIYIKQSTIVFNPKVLVQSFMVS